MSPSCLAWPRAPYQARWLGVYSPVLNVLSHDRHLTPLGSCWHGDASGVAYPKDDSPFSIGYGLLRKPLARRTLSRHERVSARPVSAWRLLRPAGRGTLARIVCSLGALMTAYDLGCTNRSVLCSSFLASASPGAAGSFSSVQRARKSATTRLNSFGHSRGGQWPQPRRTHSSESGKRSCALRAHSTGTTRSRSPWTRRVGAATSPKQSE
jgi:hypothetical protein